MSTEPDPMKPFLDRLAKAAPHPGRLDRDALLFDAGRRSARRGAFWPLTALGLAVLSAILVIRPARVVEVERIVYLPAPAATAVAEPAEPAEPVPQAAPLPREWIDGLRLRQRVARDGVNALSSTTWAAPASSANDVPDFAALRLNAPATKGDRLR